MRRASHDQPSHVFAMQRDSKGSRFHKSSESLPREERDASASPRQPGGPAYGFAPTGSGPVSPQ